MRRRDFLLQSSSAAILLGARSIMLAENGKSAYSICISRDASPSEHRAATELQRFLEEMSGARLPVLTDADNPKGKLILVGNSRAVERLRLGIAFDRLEPEGFALRTSGETLIIAGGRKRGTMYGVSTFLEKLGCRWFTRDLSRIPKMRTITIAPLDETHKPAFEYREILYTEALDKDWAARNKTNGGHSQLDESTGGKVQYYPFVHSFYKLVPPEKYFASHPEYFSLVAGKRISTFGQLCLSNPEVLRIATEAVFRWIKEHPEAEIYSVSQNDQAGWCECDKCRRIEEEEGGRHSGPILRFVNAIAEQVEKKHPDKLIDTLAYTFSIEPPTKTRPRPNVRIRLCPIGVCEGHPYEICPHNTYFMGNLRAWSKITNQLYIWHYVTNFWNYLMPHPNFDELAADVPMYHNHGVVGLFMQGGSAPGGGAENAELRSYVLSKLLWDPKVDVNRTIHEFMQAYYGKGAPAMHEWFEATHRLVRFPPAGEGESTWPYRGPHFSPAFFRKSEELFRKAETAASTPETLHRVRKAKLSLDCAETIYAKKCELKNGRYGPVDLEDYKRRFTKFMRDTRSFGVIRLHELYDRDVDEHRFAKYARFFPVLTMENASLHLVVIPELSGRVVRMIDKRTGREALRQSVIEERNYPDHGGIFIYAHPTFNNLGRTHWYPDWSLVSASAREVRMVGTLPNGLRFTRRLWMPAEEPVIHTENKIENTASKPVHMVLQARGEANPMVGKHISARLHFQRENGQVVDQQLFPTVARYFGVSTMAGAQRPDGEWQVTNPKLGITLKNRFFKDQVENCWLWWRARGENRIFLSLWSPERDLAPGETMRLDADYSVSTTEV